MIQESKDQLHSPVLPLFCTASLSFMHADFHRVELLEHLCNAAAVLRAYLEVLSVLEVAAKFQTDRQTSVSYRCSCSTGGENTNTDVR